jgi:hypothetical protein
MVPLRLNFQPQFATILRKSVLREQDTLIWHREQLELLLALVRPSVIPWLVLLLKKLATMLAF